MNGVRKVDNDLAVPVTGLLRNILLSTEWHSQEKRVCLIRVFNGLGADAGTKFVNQRRGRLWSADVCDFDFDILAGTNGVLHKRISSLSAGASILEG